MAASSSQGLARWEVENNVQQDDDALLQYDEAIQQAIQQEAPWKNNPNHFKKCACDSDDASQAGLACLTKFAGHG